MFLNCASAKIKKCHKKDKIIFRLTPLPRPCFVNLHTAGKHQLKLLRFKIFRYIAPRAVEVRAFWG